MARTLPSVSWLPGDLGILLCIDNTGKIYNGRVLHDADDARGYRATDIIWLRGPSRRELEIVLPCLGIK